MDSHTYGPMVEGGSGGNLVSNLDTTGDPVAQRLYEMSLAARPWSETHEDERALYREWVELETAERLTALLARVPCPCGAGHYVDPPESD